MTRRNLSILVTSLFLMAALSAVRAAASANNPGSAPHGTWYLALDAGPYGLDGLSLPGLVAVHADRTVLLSDAGDFGGMPFGRKDSPQFGSWRYTRAGIKIKTLFLQADSVGDVLAWFRVEIDLTRRNRNTMDGTVNVYTLGCDLPAPFAAFSCPDPIDKADEFVPADLPNVPVTLHRLRP
ncbi:MAG: hypothetical protein JJ992_03535 [Planctomycetes bacterium]|nr:hypothetical protein [Planctomycetota bacterium]